MNRANITLACAQPQSIFLKRSKVSRRIIQICILGLILTGCARSPEVNFYVLNPISEQQQTNQYHDIHIGLDEITIPPYMNKPQFIIHSTPHLVKMSEKDQWAGPLDKNIQRVIKVNLSTLLPGTVIENIPWSNQFKPNYQLSIDISQFEVDISGDSIFRASYVIYSGDQIRKKGTVYYHQKTTDVTMNTLVTSMNANLNRFTYHIAKVLSAILRTPAPDLTKKSVQPAAKESNHSSK